MQSGWDQEAIGAAIEHEAHRIAPFQRRPEWQRWLAGMDAGLNELAHLVPDLPSDPWTQQGARRAEASALALFPDLESASLNHSPANRDRIDAFRRFLGELMVRRFDGVWVAIDFDAGKPPQPAVQLPYSTTYVNVSATLTAAMHRRTGVMWARLVSRQERAHARWEAAGRPSLASWIAVGDP